MVELLWTEMQDGCLRQVDPWPQRIQLQGGYSSSQVLHKYPSFVVASTVLSQMLQSLLYILLQKQYQVLAEMTQRD